MEIHFWWVSGKVGGVRAAFVNIVVRNSIDIPAQKCHIFLRLGRSVRSIYRLIAREKLHKICEMGLSYRKLSALPELQARFHKAKVPLYRNTRKSGLNRPWLERAVCWKSQEVSSMLITRWNEASRALPVLALKSNYLDRWPNDWSGGIWNQLSFQISGVK